MNNGAHFQMQCLSCGKIQQTLPQYRCQYCTGELDILYDYERIKHSWQDTIPAPLPWAYGLEHFQEILPGTLGLEQSLGEGNTPLVKSRYYSKKLGLPNLYFKCEHLNPTGSFKDREIAVGLATMLDFQHGGSVISSSGNAGAALATYSAKNGLPALILVPKETPMAKLVQIKRHGATIWSIEGASANAENYLARGKAVQHIAQVKNWAPLVTARYVNPFTTEGAKTISYEIVAQLGRQPDWIVSPVGGGGLLAGIVKGLEELRIMGFIPTVTRVIGVQMEGCSTVARAFLDNAPIKPVIPNTKINGIGAPIPFDAEWALNSIRFSKGTALELQDASVFKAAADLARFEGMFVEPAGAASVAALKNAVEGGFLKAEDTVVCCLTGSAFKGITSLVDELDAVPVVEVDGTRLQQTEYLNMKFEEGFQ